LTVRTAERFRAARRDSSLAILEGFHPLKHALRFGGDIVEAICVERGEVIELARRLAPDVEDALLSVPMAEVDERTFRAAAPRPPSPVLALARRPAPPLTPAADAPIVVLDRPTHHGNVGAVVRVAAAAGAGGVICLEGADPWHPAALRAGAGLQFAVAAAAAGRASLEDLAGKRPVVAVVPGAPPATALLPRDAVLLFGAERAGLGSDLHASADLEVGIPMRAGVSSLNLATAVAVVLYGYVRYARPAGIQGSEGD